MAQIVGCFSQDGEEHVGLQRVDSYLRLSARSLSGSASTSELYQMTTRIGYVLLWGGKPVNLSDLDLWARRLLLAVESDEPCVYLSKGPLLLHSGLAYSLERHRLLLVVGRFGCFPLYLCRGDNSTWFANYPGLLLGRVKLTLNINSLGPLLSFCHCMGQMTTTREMQSLGPGEIWRLELGQAPVYCGRYVEPIIARQQEEPGKSQDVNRRAIHALQRAVRSCLTSDNSLLTLTGGLDSRLLLALIGEYPVETFTFGSSNSTDCRIAAQLADVTGKRHVRMDTLIPEDAVPHWADLVVRASGGEKPLDNAHVALPWRAYMPYTGRTLLTGNGGEFARAYFYEVRKRSLCVDCGSLHGLQSPDIRRHLRIRMLGGPRNERYVQYVLGRLEPEYRSRLVDATEKALDNALVDYSEDLPYADLMDDFYLSVRVRRFIMLGQQLNGLFFVRAHPYLDAAVIESLAQLPLSDRLHSRFHREAITTLDSRLAQVPWDKTGLPLQSQPSLRSHVPRRLLRWLHIPHYTIVPFMDYGEAFRGLWRDWFADTVTEIGPYLSEVISQRELTRLRDEHLAGQSNHTRVFGVFLSFGLWAKLLHKHASGEATAASRWIDDSDTPMDKVSILQ